MQPMRRTFAQFTVVVLLLVQICSPLFETIDRWDQFPQTGSDFVLTVLAVLLLFALLLLARCVLVFTLQLAHSPIPSSTCREPASSFFSAVTHLTFLASPPLPLRI